MIIPFCAAAAFLAPEDHYAASSQQSLVIKEPELNPSFFAGDVF